MSTKVYNAYIFSGNAEELMTIFKEIKKEYTELTKRHLFNLKDNLTFKKTRYKFLDSDTTMKDLTNNSFGEFVLADIIEFEKKRNEHHLLNIEASSITYFCEDKIYVQFFGLPSAYLKIILNRYTQFKDYHYQNSTDMSNYDWDNEPWDSMTEERQTELEKEWEERERIWEKLMPDWSAPSESGFEFDFGPKCLSMFCYDILKTMKID